MHVCLPTQNAMLCTGQCTSIVRMLRCKCLAAQVSCMQDHHITHLKASARWLLSRSCCISAAAWPCLTASTGCAGAEIGALMDASGAITAASAASAHCMHLFQSQVNSRQKYGCRMCFWDPHPGSCRGYDMRRPCSRLAGAHSFQNARQQALTQTCIIDYEIENVNLQ